MTIAQRIACFETVRDMPYHIGLGEDDVNCNCVTKCDLLADKLAKIGLESRPIICTFDWTESPLPAHILSLPREPGETHQFLEVLIPETHEWVPCDPTWDKDLHKAGFPIATWDGLTGTILAVNPHHLYSATETLQVIADENNPEAVTHHMDVHTPFYDAINTHLQSLRQPG